MPTFESLPIDRTLMRDLRSDHAGEVGAVQIYRGILAVSRSAHVRSFAAAHLASELEHRRFFDTWLPKRHQSRILFAWRAAGWSLGAFAALFGAATVFRTIAAVETFVEAHYREQIDRLRGLPSMHDLLIKLESFCADEIAHRLDAAARVRKPAAGPAQWSARAWTGIVAAGSVVGVAIARRI